MAGVAVAFLLAGPSTGRALGATLKVDFESGPPLGTAIENQYLSTAFVFWQRSDPGFRPYRRTAPMGVPTQSGNVFADIGPDHCYPGEVDDATQCELVVPGTEARLTRTASTVKVYAGLFQPAPDDVSATLTAYDANNNEVATTTVPIGLGMTTPIAVSSAAGDIARFDLFASGPGSPGAELGFDDLTLTFPANSIPDIALSMPPDTKPVLQGHTTNVPAHVTRLNGSHGRVDFSVAGLPPGVTGTVTPNPLTGTGTNATVHLTAADDADPTPLDGARLNADPGSANVAPARRSAPFSVRVAPAFKLAASDNSTIDLPQCAPVDREFTLQRDRSFNDTVQLSVANAPSGVTAQILPSPTVPPGGDFDAKRTLRVSRNGDPISPGDDITVRAESPGYPPRSYTFHLGNVSPQATATPGFARTPRAGKPGTTVRLDGNGFCPGTVVRVGNFLAETDTDVAPDRRSLTFNTPRAATTGRIVVIPPEGNEVYQTPDALTVRSFRGEYGFSFPNYHFHGLSISELTEAVGADDLFIQVNPCWPWGSCYVPTGILDPIAAVEWPIFDAILVGGDGHCYGMNRAVQELMAGKVPYNRFASGVHVPFDLPGPSGPSDELSSYLDSRQALQLTSEALHARFERDPDLSDQIDRLKDEFAAGRFPGITLRHGTVGGHEVTGVDLNRHPDGSFDIYTYDPNRPQTQEELDDPMKHLNAETDGPAIRVNAAEDHWDFRSSNGTNFSGGGSDGSLYVVPLSDIPDNPSLPGLTDLDLIVDIFGSVDDAAVTAGHSPGARTEPLQDGAGSSGGILLSRRGAGRLTHEMRGVRSGRYSELMAAPGFVAGVNGVATAKGVHDQLTAAPKDGSLTFAGGRDRALNLALGVDRGRLHRSASVQTQASAGGADVAAIGGGRALTYRHSGDAAKVTFALTNVTKRGGPASFESPAISVQRGERVKLKPTSWRNLGRVRMVSRLRGGETRTRLLHSRARFAARFGVKRPRLAKHSVRVPVRIRRVPAQATGGIVVQVKRHGHAVIRKARAIRNPHRGRRIFRWKLPHLRDGRYKVVANVALAGGVGLPGRRAARRASSVRLR